MAAGGGGGGGGGVKTNPFTPMVAIPAVNMVSTLCALLEGLLVAKNCPPEGPKEVTLQSFLVRTCIYISLCRLWSHTLCLLVFGPLEDHFQVTK